MHLDLIDNLKSILLLFKKSVFSKLNEIWGVFLRKIRKKGSGGRGNLKKKKKNICN